MERDYLCAGIDLGTCFSCVYVYKKGSFVPVPIDGLFHLTLVMQMVNSILEKVLKYSLLDIPKIHSMM